MKQDILNNSLESLKNYLDNMSEEEKEEMKQFFKDETPKGWLSIEDHLPHFLAGDFEQGYTEIKVKDKDGNEKTSRVTDPQIWYYIVKEQGITHWFNN